MPDEHLQPLLASLGFAPVGFTRRLDSWLCVDAARLNRLWEYYRNPMRSAGDERSPRPYRHAQEWGLPRRITGEPSEGIARKEVVIENDIAWRIDVMVDFLVGGEVKIASAAPDPARRHVISTLVNQIVAEHGGTVLWQHLATIGAVHGHVDVLVKLLPPDEPLLPEPASRREESAPASPPNDAPCDPADPGASTCSLEATARLARRIRLEVVEPARALPLFNPVDRRRLDAFVRVYHLPRPGDMRGARRAANSRNWFRRWFDTAGAAPSRCRVLEIITPTRWFKIEDDKLVAHGRNSLGELPLAHIQNVAAPFQWTGASDVEPLIPLQDEINTRLSDRAHRITMQSFRMYLGKGIDNFTERSVAPGQMWMSDNPDAEIIEFGGDASCPSEDAHLRELREAMDKASGVTPIAAGILKNRIGHLTSAAALRVTMMNLLARTRRKRATYGAGIARIGELALAWLDRAGLFKTTQAERQLEVTWPQPPVDVSCAEILSGAACAGS